VDVEIAQILQHEKLYPLHLPDSAINAKAGERHNHSCDVQRKSAIK